MGTLLHKGISFTCFFQNFWTYPNYGYFTLYFMIIMLCIICCLLFWPFLQWNLVIFFVSEDCSKETYGVCCYHYDYCPYRIWVSINCNLLSYAHVSYPVFSLFLVICWTVPLHPHTQMHEHLWWLLWLFTRI